MMSKKRLCDFYASQRRKQGTRKNLTNNESSEAVIQYVQYMTDLFVIVGQRFLKSLVFINLSYLFSFFHCLDKYPCFYPAQHMA